MVDTPSMTAGQYVYIDGPEPTQSKLRLIMRPRYRMNKAPNSAN